VSAAATEERPAGVLDGDAPWFGEDAVLVAHRGVRGGRRRALLCAAALLAAWEIAKAIARRGGHTMNDQGGMRWLRQP